MNSEHSRIEWKPLLGFGALTLGTGGLAAFLTRTGTKEYAQLAQPSFAPPDWVFPVVWSILYAVMAVSAYRVTRTGRHRGAMALFGIQLAVNFFWPLIFFNLKAFWAAFYWLLLLIALIAAMIAGRIVWGIAQVILMGLSGGTFTFQIFITQALLNAIPAIILQLIIVPAIVAALRRAKLIR